MFLAYALTKIGGVDFTLRHRGFQIRSNLVRILLLLFCLIPATARASVVTDGEFVLTEWDHHRVLIGIGANRFQSEKRVTSPVGSEPPILSGAYRLTGQAFGTQQGNNYFWLHNIYTPFTYDPSLGPLTSLSVEFDTYLPSSVPGSLIQDNAKELGVSVYQGGNVFLSSGLNATVDQWQHLSFSGLSQNDFTGAGGSQPDFFTTGAPIQFGYYSYSYHRFATGAMHAVDNWRLGVNEQENLVPEPSSLITFTGLALCFGITRWVRRKRHAV